VIFIGGNIQVVDVFVGEGKGGLIGGIEGVGAAIAAGEWLI